MVIFCNKCLFSASYIEFLLKNITIYNRKITIIKLIFNIKYKNIITYILFYSKKDT